VLAASVVVNQGVVVTASTIAPTINTPAHGCHRRLKAPTLLAGDRRRMF
jgi:hypothetical protein